MNNENDNGPVEKLAAEIEKWRDQKSSRGERMPISLWRRAVDLAQTTSSMNEIAYACKLDLNTFKNKLHKNKSNLNAKKSATRDRTTMGQSKITNLDFIDITKEMNSFVKNREVPSSADNLHLRSTMTLKCILKMNTKSGLSIEVFE